MLCELFPELANLPFSQKVMLMFYPVAVFYFFYFGARINRWLESRQSHSDAKKI